MCLSAQYGGEWRSREGENKTEQMRLASVSAVKVECSH